jgi:hypothetical protein
MNRRLLSGSLGVVIAALLLLTAYPGQADPQYSQCFYRLYHYEGGTWVRYGQGDPFPGGGNLWKYEYTVHNEGLLFVNLFRIFFNSDNIDHAQYVSSTAPSGWTPSAVLPLPGFNNWKVEFETFSNVIMPGDSLSGFEVQFTWSESYLPDVQHYEVAGNIGDGGETAEYPPVAARPKTWGAVKSLFK